MRTVSNFYTHSFHKSSWIERDNSFSLEKNSLWQYEREIDDIKRIDKNVEQLFPQEHVKTERILQKINTISRSSTI